MAHMKPSVTFIAIAALTLLPGAAHAYIGPGAGFAVVTSFFVLITTFLITIFGVLLFPFRIVYKKIRSIGIPKVPKSILRSKRAVVLGLDGMEPTLLERYISEGKLPNLKALSERGGYRKLTTTVPAESPVAWSSFSTGCNPGKHNIFDFLSRHKSTYLPDYSIAGLTGKNRRIRLGKFVIPISAEKTVTHRKERSFWSYLAERGVECVIQRVPVTYPPEKFDGRLLSAMGVPDLLGTQGTFTYFTDEREEKRVKEGGRLVRVTAAADGSISSTIQGPPGPFSASGRALTIPIRITTNGDGGVLIEVSGQNIEAALGRFTDWVDLEFPVMPGFKLKGMVKFLLRSSGDEFGLYMSPINIHPEEPAMPVSHPAIYSKYLSLSNGRFNTLGLSEDTWAMNEGRLTPGEFITQCREIFEERKRSFFLELDSMKSGLLVHVFDITDRSQHMFWGLTDKEHPGYDEALAAKYGKTIEEVYMMADRLVGDVMGRLCDDDLLIVMSDHGFKSFRHAVHLNRWLVDHGYMTLKQPTDECERFFKCVDWSRTRAFALGLNGLYINQLGREPQGIVRPEDAMALKRELKGKMEAYQHPELKHKMFHAALIREDVYTGPHISHAPDILVGYGEYFRASWQTAMGGVPKGIYEPNDRGWSGDHCIATDLVPGVLVCNRKIKKREPSIMDIAPSIFAEFQTEIPSHMDGESFLL